MQHALAEAGVKNPIHVAVDGRQALEYLQGNGQYAERNKFPLPYLVLLDLKLPLLPGMEVLKWIRQAELPAIVVVLTSSENEADVTNAYRLGANAYIVKPSQLKELVEIAKAIKEFWLVRNRPPPTTKPRPKPVPATAVS